MAEGRNLVITAIRDIATENSIAAALQRLGWPIAFRATDQIGLAIASAKYPDAKIIISTDFPSARNDLTKGIILIQSREEPTAPGAIAVPQHDHELHQLLSSGISGPPGIQRAFPEIPIAVHLCAAVKAGIFSTLFSIHCASEFVSRGDRVLLLDANIDSPEIARRLSIHDIRSRIITSEFGFDVTEIDSPQYLSEVSNGSFPYDRVIIDCGELKLNPYVINGHRFQDLLISWIMRSTDSLHLVSQGDSWGVANLTAILQIIPTVTEIASIDHSILAWERKSPRQSEKLVSFMKEQIDLPTYLYTYDHRKFLMQNKENQLAIALPPLTSPKRFFLEHIERIKEVVGSTSR